MAYFQFRGRDISTTGVHEAQWTVAINETVFEHVFWSDADVSKETPKALAANLGTWTLEALDTTLRMFYRRCAYSSDNSQPILNQSCSTKWNLNCTTQHIYMGNKNQISCLQQSTYRHTNLEAAQYGKSMITIK